MKLFYNPSNKISTKSVNYCTEQVNIDIETDEGQEELISYVFSHPHGYISYDKVRGKKNFIYANALVFDFDNKEGHTESSIKEFEQSEIATNFNYILYTSKSHQLDDNGDCFHVVFPLGDVISDLKEFEYFSRLISDIIDTDLKKDPSANRFLNYNPSSLLSTQNDYDRFECEFSLHKCNIDTAFYNYEKAIKLHQLNEGQKVIKKVNTLYSFFDDKMSSVKKLNKNKVQKERSEVIEGLPEQYTTTSGIDKTISDLHFSTRYTLIDDILSDLNIHNTENRYRTIDFRNWGLLGCWISQFISDFDTGLELFSILTHPDDTADTVRTQYQSCVDATININVFVFLPMFKEAEISIHKKLGLFSKQDNSITKQATMRANEIRSVLISEVSVEYNKPVMNTRPYIVSDSDSPSSVGYIFTFDDNTSIRKVYKKGELKMKYKMDENLYNKLIISKQVHHIDIDKSSNSEESANNKITEKISEVINTYGYLTSKDITNIIKLVMAEFKFTKHYIDDNFSKKLVISKLVRSKIITGDTKRETHNGKKITTYVLVERNTPIKLVPEDVSVPINDDWDDDDTDYEALYDEKFRDKSHDGQIAINTTNESGVIVTEWKNV